MVRQRHLPRQGHLAPTDQPDIRDRLMRGAIRAGRDHRRAGAREARDAVDARGLDRLGEGHQRQHGGEPPRQPRRARPEKATEQAMMVRTPALAFACRLWSLVMSC